LALAGLGTRRGFFIIRDIKQRSGTTGGPERGLGAVERANDGQYRRSGRRLEHRGRALEQHRIDRRFAGSELILERAELDLVRSLSTTSELTGGQPQ